MEPWHIISGRNSGDIYGGWDRYGRTREMRRRHGGLIDRAGYKGDFHPESEGKEKFEGKPGETPDWDALINKIKNGVPGCCKPNK